MIVDDLAERQNALRLFNEYMSAVDALVVAYHAGATADEIDELTAAVNEAERVYDDCGYELDCDYSDEPTICARTGTPIIIGDKVIHDMTTNEVFLRVCV